MIQNEEFIEDFLTESQMHLQSIEVGLIQIEKQFDEETVHTLFRAVHSIKGTAGFFGLSNIINLSHSMENIFGEMRKHNLSPNKEMITLFMTALDLLKSLISDIHFGETLDISDVIDSINALSKGKDESPQSFEFMTAYNNKIQLSNINDDLMRTFIDENYFFYHIQLGMNHELINYEGGPIKMFYRIEAIGSLLDTCIDYSAIESLDHVLDALSDSPTDIILNIYLASKLEKNDVAVVTNVSSSLISQITLLNDKTKEESQETQVLNTENVKTPALQSESSQKNTDDYIQVKLSKLDHLMDLIGELVISESIVTQNPEVLEHKITSFEKASNQHRKLILELKDLITDVRLIPLNQLFLKMKRIIRDISVKLDKDVEVTVEGESIEVDKNIVENISDPLMHLVRNAMDHGIESKNKRLEKNKPSTGHILLKAYKQGNEIVVKIEDDGQGLNATEIYQTALNKNMVSEEKELMSDQDIFNLILQPGFSTKEKVTEYSGRGVGMDVVLKNIKKIGGSINIDSILGFGTSFSIKLPQTLSIIEGMLVSVENATYIIPTLNISQCIIPDDNILVQSANNQAMILIENKSYPIIYLNQYLGLEHSLSDKQNGVLIEINNDNGKAILWVDEIINHQQIVIKKLPHHLKHSDKINGCTLLGA